MTRFTVARPPRHGTALAAFTEASRVLGRRARGQHCPGAPDWLDPNAVHSLWLALPDGDGRTPTLTVALTEGLPLSTLPAHFGGPFGMPIAGTRAPRAQAQSAPAMRALSNPGLLGTATALLGDALSPRQFVLTCGHVAAGLPTAAVNDQVDILAGPASTLRGRLVDWQPSLGAGVLRTGLDAALVELASADALALRQRSSWMSTGVNTRPIADQAVTLRRVSAPLQALLKVYWSGLVDVPGYTPGVADYFLEGGIGYAASQPTVGGDSGAAVWDDQDRLMGMHVGALPGATGGDANAVYAPIQPVLDWYSVQLQTRSGAGHPVGVSSASSTGPVPALKIAAALGTGGFPASELEVVACTLWGEARNQGVAGMRAVASVIENRRQAGYRRKRSASDVCLDPWQFSCWNANDRNLGRMRAVARAPDAEYREALTIADEVVKRTLGDSVKGARHYHAATMPKPPSWAKGKTPCIVIGDHLFFNDID